MARLTAARPAAAHIVLTGLIVIGVLLLGPAAAVAERPAQAQAQVTVLAENVEYVFAQSARFALEAASDRPVTEAQVVLTRIGDHRAYIGPVPLAPTTRVSVSYTINLQAVAPPPFSRMLYSWRLTTDDGGTVETPQQEFLYEDNRFRWQGRGLAATGALPAMEVRWAAGDERQFETVLDAAGQSVPEIERLTGAKIASPVRIYLYPSLQDLQAALRLAGVPDWAAGHADVRQGALLVAAPPDDIGLQSLYTSIPHELAHLAVYSRMRDRYDSVPPWLNEGLATLVELQQDPALARGLSAAAAAGSLRPIAELCVPFSEDRQTALLEYAQSESLVRYVVNRYGASKLPDLLDAHAERLSHDPAACDGAVRQVLGISLDQLQADWQAYLGSQSPEGKAREAVGPWIVLVIAITLVSLVLLRRAPASG